MPGPIIWEEREVRSDVATLGLERDLLIECVRFAEHERSFVTHNDALGFASMVVYDKAGRALREAFVGRDGWVKDDSNNQCSIKNPTTMVRVVPCNFDEAAGNLHARPRNKAPKGEISRKKSLCNRTGWLPGVPRGEASMDSDGYQTWLLGIFADDDLPTKAELSLPIEFDGHYFTDFAKRIMLITGDDDLAAIRTSPDGSGEGPVEVVDISIRRK